jgi:hypothetical protein
MTNPVVDSLLIRIKELEEALEKVRDLICEYDFMNSRFEDIIDKVLDK